MFERGRAFTLGGEIDDHLWLLAVDKLHQEVKLVIDVIGVIAIPRIALTNTQCEALVLRQVAADRNDFGGVGMLEQILRGMKAKGTAPTQHSVRLLHRPRS